MREEEYKALVSFIAEMLHRSRKKAECYNDLVLVAAKLLDSYDPAEYLDEEAMIERVRKVLHSMYRVGQLRI